MLAGSLDLEEPWYITGAEFNPVKNVMDVHVGIREDAVIACPHCGVQQVTAPFERQNSRHTLLFEGYAMMIMADVFRAGNLETTFEAVYALYSQYLKRP